MASLLSIPVIISIGDVSVYLSSNDNSKGALFGRKLASPISPIEIAIATDALRWGYEGDSTDTTLRGTANYLLWMCGKYSLQAQYIISGTGGGSVVPIPGGSLPAPIQFVVSATSSPMVTGDSSVVLSTFIGYYLLFTRGGITQSTVTSEPSYYSWDITTGTFTCTPAAYEGELFQLYAIS